MRTGRDTSLKNRVGVDVGSPPTRSKVTQSRWLMNLVVMVCLLMATGKIWAQLPPNYALAVSSGTYTPITVGGGATAPANAFADDVNQNITGLPGFTVNGVTYTNFQMNSNGRLVLYATTAPTTSTNYLPLSSTTGLANAGVVIAPFGADLITSSIATSSWVYQVVGTELIFQWNNVSRINDSTLALVMILLTFR
ncbi:hypothetical protein [Flavobacterium sp. 3HN19-14]|uniref:hypothetical protein n=1 Tax=Flavobacterium sp. 3HN19-14 TaxID=3448133 RepID=UPI003EDEDA15